MSLPDAPNLDWLRKQARRRLDELRNTNPAAKLADAQFDVATEHGFSSWLTWKVIALHAIAVALTGCAEPAGEKNGIGPELVAANRRDHQGNPTAAVYWTGIARDLFNEHRAIPTLPAPPMRRRVRRCTAVPYLRSGDPFLPAPPPAFGSDVFSEGFAEVREIADTRSPRQDSIAQFGWFEAGTDPGPTYWYNTAMELTERHGRRERDAAHLFALMNPVAFDAINREPRGQFTY
jgi:hypothetical protein